MDHPKPERKGESQLLPQHQHLIEASGIIPEVAAVRGYRSVVAKRELQSLGFGDKQSRTPALLIPIYSVFGEIANYQIRPDEPRIDKRDKAVKYETPASSRMVLDVHPLIKEKLTDPSFPLFITEGVRKSDAAVSRDLCCIAVLGVWNWRGTNEYGGKTALPDWELIALNAREVLICFDSDVMLKPEVYLAMVRLKAFMERKGARVRLIYLPPGVDGTKIGLDDFLAAGKDINDLLALASDEIRPLPSADDGTTSSPYEETSTGIVWRKSTRDGEVATPLTNFTAKITGQIIEDDGAETKRLMEMTARLKDREVCFRLSTNEFDRMNWHLEHLGSGAVVYAGFGLKDHARTAIQLLNPESPERRVYTHTGWRQIDEQWAYLHAGGAIGAHGLIEGVEVRLPESLTGFRLPTTFEESELVSAIRASLGLLEVAPDIITVPLLSAVYRAPIQPADFSMHIPGPTGVGKSVIAALAQQHSGSTMDARHLPGSWSSTGNALEGVSFMAKDALLVVDDFAPVGSQTDVMRLNREADRLFRAQGNQAGRQRMRSDTSLRPAKSPRGLLLSTGEDIPSGESLRARLITLELSPEMLRWERVSRCQTDAAEGRYALSMAGYVRWLAARYEEIIGVRGWLHTTVIVMRDAIAQHTQHRRTPEAIAQLAAAFRLFLLFAQDSHAISAEEAGALWERAWQALIGAATLQATYQAAAEPAQRFLQLISASIASGRSYLIDGDGRQPEEPEIWGWRRRSEGAFSEWQPQGNLIGWVADGNVYLEPEAAYAAAQSFARLKGENLSTASRTLHKRLYEKGWLLSTEVERNTLTVRRVLAGTRRTVLHLHAGSLMPRETAQTDHTDQEQPDIGSQTTPEPTLLGSLGSSEIRREEQTLTTLAHTTDDPSFRYVEGSACYTCGGTLYWTRGSRPLVCANCHPCPQRKAEQAEGEQVEGVANDEQL